MAWTILRNSMTSMRRSLPPYSVSERLQLADFSWRVFCCAPLGETPGDTTHQRSKCRGGGVDLVVMRSVGERA
jgi:hypothetical protein